MDSVPADPSTPNSTEARDAHPEFLQSDLLERTAYVLYLETWTLPDEDVSDLTDEQMRSLGEKWQKEWLPARHSDHCGDCTNAPMACLRCAMDELFKNAERILRSR